MNSKRPGTYRIGFGWVGKLAVVTAVAAACGATLVGGVAMADVKPAVATSRDVVQLEPVTVTISAERFDAVRASR